MCSKLSHAAFMMPQVTFQKATAAEVPEGKTIKVSILAPRTDSNHTEVAGLTGKACGGHILPSGYH